MTDLTKMVKQHDFLVMSPGACFQVVETDGPNRAFKTKITLGGHYYIVTFALDPQHDGARSTDQVHGKDTAVGIPMGHLVE